MSTPLLGYVDRPGPLHALTGTAKLVLAAGIVVAGMISFDARFLAVLGLGSVLTWWLSRVRVRDLAVVLGIIAVFMLLNNVLIFLFAPGYGSELFGTRHVLLDGPWGWDLTSEQLFYQLVVSLKYVAVIPSVLLFVATTRPPEFASSLNRVGVPYRAAYAVSLALRYIPEVQRDYRTISQAQQARGLDMSARASLGARLRNLVSVLMPLLLGSLERIETVSSAMELRGFGRGRRRTWYTARPMRAADAAVMVLAGVLVAVAIALVVLDGGRYWNPFVA